MRLPTFLKALTGCVDTESSRYSLGAVYFEHEAGVTTATATDGRQMVSVSYADTNKDETPSGVMVEGASLAKAFGISGRKTKGAKPTTFSIVNGRALVNGAGGDALAAVVDGGKFPRYRDVFEGRDGATDTQVLLSPELLSQVVKVYAEAGVASIRFHIKDHDSSVMLSGTAPTGEVIRAVIMPREPEDKKQAKVAYAPAFGFKADAVKPVKVTAVAPVDAKAKLAAIAAKAG